MNEGIGPRRLAHVNLFVTDLERSSRFYQQVCGFTEVFREDGISMAFLSNGNTHHDVALMEVTTGPRVGKDGHTQVSVGRGKRPGLNHLGMEMESEAMLVEAYRRIKGSTEVRVDRTSDHQITRSMYLYDPDGHMLEFYADIVDDWREVYRRSAGELISSAWDPVSTTEPRTASLYQADPKIDVPEHAPLASRATTFAGLPVRDLAASTAFYQRVIGMRVAFTDDKRFVALSGGAGSGCDVVLIQKDERPKTGLLFAGIQMASGRSPRDSADLLDAEGVASTFIGRDSDSGEPAALLISDPDDMSLMYVSRPAAEIIRGDIDRILDLV